MSYGKHEDKCTKAEIINFSNDACCNTECKKVLRTDRKLQLAVKRIPCGCETGLKVHEHSEQLIRVESGSAKIFVGKSENCMKCIGKAACGDVIFIPENTWFNIANAGCRDLKLSFASAPPEYHKPK